MELGTAIIALSVILACIIPVVMIRRSNRKREQQFLQELSNLAELNHCTMAHHDLWNNAGIGADESYNNLFFIKKAGDADTRQHVNLTEVEKCVTGNTSTTLNTPSGTQKMVERLELTFQSRDKNKKETVLVFYDVNSDSLTLSGELQLVEKWSKIANERIESLRLG